MPHLKEEFIQTVGGVLWDRTSPEFPCIEFLRLVQHVVEAEPQASAGAVQDALLVLEKRTLAYLPEGITEGAEICRTDRGEFVRQ